MYLLPIIVLYLFFLPNDFFGMGDFFLNLIFINIHIRWFKKNARSTLVYIYIYTYKNIYYILNIIHYAHIYIYIYTYIHTYSIIISTCTSDRMTTSMCSCCRRCTFCTRPRSPPSRNPSSTRKTRTRTTCRPRRCSSRSGWQRGRGTTGNLGE